MERIEELAQKLFETLEAGRRELDRREQLLGAAVTQLAALEEGMEGLPHPSRKGMQEALKSLRQHIERLREESSQDAGRRLTALQGVAEEFREELTQRANLATLGELSASVAHEIRNPLCGMLFSLDVLRTKMDDDDSRTVLLDNVRREAERMEKIVQNLLHFARNYKPRLAPCEIEQIVRASVESVESILKKRNVTVEFRNCARDGRVAVDCELMSQVFKNLLTNSVEASPAGRALVAEVLDMGEGKIGIAFTDRGEGVSEEDIPRIFEPFHSSKEKGVGLGLAVSKKIVEAHSGWIEVRSERGKGTTFTVVLPRNL